MRAKIRAETVSACLCVKAGHEMAKPANVMFLIFLEPTSTAPTPTNLTTTDGVTTGDPTPTPTLAPEEILELTAASFGVFSNFVLEMHWCYVWSRPITMTRFTAWNSAFTFISDKIDHFVCHDISSLSCVEHIRSEERYWVISKVDKRTNFGKGTMHSQAEMYQVEDFVRRTFHKLSCQVGDTCIYFANSWAK